mmetsp:Transcript_69610/g.110338  ORF Transcript_69610/g.110338 Transcript_69610/m.110338 type:complete len:103 (+) Transcript_69610:214-522(+)
MFIKMRLEKLDATTQRHPAREAQNRCTMTFGSVAYTCTALRGGSWLLGCTPGASPLSAYKKENKLSKLGASGAPSVPDTTGGGPNAQGGGPPIAPKPAGNGI